MYFGISFVCLRCFRVYQFGIFLGCIFRQAWFRVPGSWAVCGKPFRFFHSSCHWFQHPGCRSQILAINLLHLRLTRRFLGHFLKQLTGIFLASCGMFEIVFSLPVGMCLWVIGFGQKIYWYQLLAPWLAAFYRRFRHLKVLRRKMGFF